jgi:hypothetical protein
MDAPFDLSLPPGAHLLAFDGTELVFNSRGARGPATGVLDLAVTPPGMAMEQSAGTLDASRSRSGRWILHQYVGPKPPYAWRLRVRARASDERPEREEPVPLPVPDVTEVLPHLDCEVARRIEQEETRALDGAVFVGERPLIVPRHMGFGGRHHPFVLRDGAWVEERSLPAYTKSPAELLERCAVHVALLGDGGDVLVWDGAGFEHDGRGFARTFERPIDMGWTSASRPVPAGADGFFYVGETMKLTEVHRGAGRLKVHLPELHVWRMWPGPSGTLVLRASSGAVLLYDPREEAFAEIPQEMVPPDATLAAWSEGGFLVVLDRDRPDRLAGVAHADLDALPRKHVCPEARRARVPMRAALRGGWPVSRPLLAADSASRTVVTAHAGVIEAHRGDVPAWRVELSAEVVAVAADAKHVSALDAEGVLHGLGTADGARIGAVTLGRSPRSLSASSTGRLAVLDAGGVHLLDEAGARKLPFEAPLAASFDGAGRRLVVTGERRRAALITRKGAVDTLPEPPEEVHAIAWMGGNTWLALGERSLLRLDAGKRAWRKLSDEETGDHLALSPGGTRIAQGVAKGAVHFVAADTMELIRSMTYPDSFQDDEPLAVTGLAFLGETEAVVGLTGGNANILDLENGTAVRLDPFPGHAHRRWVFIYDGQFLVAG